jgi:tetratricopeptide (TPR) repeat protein
MRWLVLALAAVLVVPAPASAQQAWVVAYKDGVELFEKANNDALAEQRLIEAREKGPKQSRRHNFSSVDYRPFIPDFYLGLIYVRTGRVKQGQEYIERAIRDGLVKPDDKTYALASTALDRVRDEQARLARNTVRPNPPDVAKPPATTQPPATNTATTPNTQLPANTATNTVTPPAVVKPPVVTPPANQDPVWLASFRREIDAAHVSLRESRYTEARSHLESAESLPADATRRQEALALRRSIDAAQSVEALRTADRARAAIAAKNIDVAQAQVVRLETVAPGHSALAGLRAGVEQLRGSLQGVARIASIERLGVKLFLEGNYKESAAQLERAVGSGVTSPRIYLFLASSHAALALLAPPAEKDALVDTARRHYQQAKPAVATLAADQKFISPSIQKVLSGG